MGQDILIVGGGHNGLVCAAYLARAGRRVTLFERRPRLGGAAVTEEVFPGFHFSVCAYVVSLLRPEIIQELRLREHGLEILPLDGTFTPLDDAGPGGAGPGSAGGRGGGLWRPEDTAAAQREIARFSTRDAEAYPRFIARMAAMAAFVKPLLAMTPPDPGEMDSRGLFDLLALGKRFRGLSRADQHLLVRLMTASAADFVSDWFESEPLRGTLASSGIIGTNLGARSPGTAYVLLHHYMGEIEGAYRSWGLPRHGMGAVSESIAAAARAAGATLRTDAGVAQIVVSNGRATGIVLENGEEHHAPVIVSNADLRVTFERLVGFTHVPDDFAEAVGRYRFRGSSAKVNLALDDVPTFTCRPGTDAHDHHLRGAISISPDIDYLERAYDESKYGRFSTAPYLDIVIPSLTDPSIAPPGKHVMSCFVQYAPYALAPANRGEINPSPSGERPGGEGALSGVASRGTDGAAPWDREREALGDAVIDAIARFAPNIRERILHRQVVTPLDLERQFGLTEGNIFQGELSPDQLFSFRPLPGFARYRTPVDGLYLCGASTHPGGGVMGAPGRNAAREVLKDSKRWRW